MTPTFLEETFSINRSMLYNQNLAKQEGWALSIVWLSYATICLTFASGVPNGMTSPDQPGTVTPREFEDNEQDAGW
jgi:hypothetical protein